MDIVNFWNKQVSKWNDESKCGFCWEFGAPLVKSAANIQQKREFCCVNVLLTNLWEDDIPTFVVNEPYEVERKHRFGFTLWVGIQSDLGTNNFNEIKNHPIEESKWETIFQPLSECLGPNLFLDECEIQGYLFKRTAWRKDLILNDMDLNLSGWKITASFEE